MLRTNERSLGDVMILDVDGVVDPGPAELVLGDEVRRVVSLGHQRLLLNLTAFTSANASAINALLDALRAARSAAAELLLVNVGRRLKALLALSGLHEHFMIFDCEQAALALLAARRGKPPSRTTGDYSEVSGYPRRSSSRIALGG